MGGSGYIDPHILDLDTALRSASHPELISCLIYEYLDFPQVKGPVLNHPVFSCSVICYYLYGYFLFLYFLHSACNIGTS